MVYSKGIYTFPIFHDLVINVGGFQELEQEREDIYSEWREVLLDEDLLTAEEEAFMKGWDEALKDN